VSENTPFMETVTFMAPYVREEDKRYPKHTRALEAPAFSLTSGQKYCGFASSLRGKISHTWFVTAPKGLGLSDWLGFLDLVALVAVEHVADLLIRDISSGDGTSLQPAHVRHIYNFVGDVDVVISVEASRSPVDLKSSSEVRISICRGVKSTDSWERLHDAIRGWSLGETDIAVPGSRVLTVDGGPLVVFDSTRYRKLRNAKEDIHIIDDINTLLYQRESPLYIGYDPSEWLSESSRGNSSSE